MPSEREFPALYHAHHALHPEDIPFWRELAEKQAGPVLELGCGTGRVLMPLAQVCEPVFGLDNDPGMLAYLRQVLPPELRPRIHIWQADLTAFHLALPFGLILLPCNTISMLTKEARRSMLELVYCHLRPGGLFAASMPNPLALAELPDHADPEVEEIFPHPLDGEPVQVSSAWERSSGFFTVYWHYDHLLPNGRIRRVSAQARHRLELPESYQNELAAAGFEETVIFGDFDRSPYSNDSPSLILVAARGKR